MTSVLFQNLTSSGEITASSFIISLASALLLGLLLAFVYGRTGEESKGFLTTIGILPGIVAVVIMLVSGSLGASVAVAGTFSLVRFRSNPGTAREICAVFLAMAVGLACGIGYPLFGAIFAAVICLVNFIYEKVGAAGEALDTRRTMHITVPEDLNYSGAFDDLFAQYTTYAKLVRVKTTNLGSLNKLTYDIKLKEKGVEKDFIDDLRVRNGNLEIDISDPHLEGAL
ncbi:MAG: DUF4956 domain-containing protein [Eubacterium sp.]|jgi:hypothetical protein